MPDEDTTVQRRCRTCKIEKPLAEYHRGASRPLGRQYVCKACLSALFKTPAERAKRRKINAKRNATSREIMQKLKSRPCMDCGGVFPPYVMEFDHPDRAIKTGTISQMLGGGVTPRVLAEIEKTDLICSNCHKIRTRRQFEQGEWKSGRPRFDGTHHTDDPDPTLAVQRRPGQAAS